DDVRRPGPDVLKALGDGAGQRDFMRGGGEGLAHLLGSQVRVVVDEQQLGHGWRPAGKVGLTREANAVVRAVARTTGRRNRHGSTTWKFCLPVGILFAGGMVGGEFSCLASLLSCFG